LSGKPTSQVNLLPGDWNCYPSGVVISKTLQSITSRGDLTAARIKQVAFYDRGIRALNISDFVLPKLGALSHYPVRTHRKKQLVNYLWENGVFVSSNLFDHLLCDYTWLNVDESVTKSFPNARNLVETTIHLPLYDALTETQQEKIINLLAQFTG